MYSALYWRDGQYVRVDLNAESWKARNDNIEPLSAWQAVFVPPPPPAAETLKKDDAESLLRRLISENATETRNARYILALMLERKKMIRQIERQRQEGGSILVYEHGPTGEVWLIEDPGLKLGELKAVQEEVSNLLARAAAPVEIAPAVVASPEGEVTPEVPATDTPVADEPSDVALEEPSPEVPGEPSESPSPSEEKP